MKTILASRSLLVLLTCSTLISCKKKEDEGPSGAWTTDIATNAPVNDLLKELAPTPTVKTFPLNSLGANYAFSINDELDVYCRGRVYNAAGTQLTSGTLTISVLKANTRGDLIRNNIPTVSDGRLLVTGGAIKITPTVNGQPVRFDQDYRFTWLQPRGEYQSFYGEAKPNNGFNWNLNADSANGTPMPDSSFFSPDTSKWFYHYCCFSKFDWINCDYFYNTTGPLTKLKVKLPIGYTKQNTAAFVVFNTIRSVAGLYGNSASQMFETSGGYEAPVGMDVKIITISKLGSDYYLGMKDMTIPNNQVIDITPVQKTKREVDDIINGL